jgi:DNA-binding NarL/FixJ family response regulator
MTSITIRINDDTKQELNKRIQDFQSKHGIKLTLDQYIKKLLHSPPAKCVPKPVSKKVPNRKLDILKLHQQGVKTADIARNLKLSARYCREVIQYNKDT